MREKALTGGSSVKGSHFLLRVMRPIWAVYHASREIQAKSARVEEEEKEMAHRKLTLKEQLKGIKAALRSTKTPPQLKAALRRRANFLRDMFKREDYKNG